MDRFEVEGGAPLEGALTVAGAKNAVLPILAAGLLAEDPLEVRGAPDLSDVRTMRRLLVDLGVSIDERPDGDEPGGALTLHTPNDPDPVAPWEHVRKMRASVCVLGPLLARTGRAEVSLPGGCVFGVRPIDVHLKGLEALGATIEIEHGNIVATAPAGGLKGGEVFLGTAHGPSVTGTMNVLMAACLAEGQSVIHGAACEPEVEDLGRCLQTMGAKILGLGSPTLEIEGVSRLGGGKHTVLPDRIEAGTFLVAGALCGGRVRIERCKPNHLMALLDRLKEAGYPIERGPDWIEVRSEGPAQRPRPTDVTTQPHPGFPTDLQAQWMALMSTAEGVSLITERIYPDRYMHLPELVRLGARIRRQEATAVVEGVGQLSGTDVMASDLRASAALVLAGLVAKGTTQVHRVYHLDRGYDRFDLRLQELGAKIRRVRDE